MKLIEKNSKKGITLIALVITIIVLLILAGVSISMLTGDNSLLGNAQKTGPANNIGAAKDEVGLAYNTAMQEYYETKYASTNGTNGTFATKLETAINEITSKGRNHGCGIVYDKDAGTITITNGGYKVIGTVDTTDDSAGISWGEMNETNGEITTNEKIVTASDIIGNETKYYGKAVKNYTLTDKTADGEDYIFRIFYVDKDNTFGDGANTVYLKADPCDDTGLSGYTGYSPKTTTYLENHNKSWASERLSKSSSWNVNEHCVAWLCDPNNFTEKYKTTGELASKVNYVIGAPGVEMYVKSYNQTHPGGYTTTYNGTKYGELGATYRATNYPGYIYTLGGKQSTVSNSDYGTGNNTIDNSGFEQMYCYCKAGTFMWLASPSAYLDRSVCYVGGYYAYVAAGFGDALSLAPLVSLSSEVQLQI